MYPHVNKNKSVCTEEYIYIYIPVNQSRNMLLKRKTLPQKKNEIFPSSYIELFIPFLEIEKPEKIYQTKFSSKEEHIFLRSSKCLAIKAQMMKNAEPKQIPLCNSHLPRKSFHTCIRLLLPNQENPHHYLPQSKKATEAISETTTPKHQPKALTNLNFRFKKTQKTIECEMEKDNQIIECETGIYD